MAMKLIEGTQNYYITEAGKIYSDRQVNKRKENKKEERKE